MSVLAQFKSCLDIAIASKNLLPFMESFTIQIIYAKKVIHGNSNNFPIKIISRDLPKKKVKELKTASWNLNKTLASFGNTRLSGKRKKRDENESNLMKEEDLLKRHKIED